MAEDKNMGEFNWREWLRNLVLNQIPFASMGVGLAEFFNRITGEDGPGGDTQGGPGGLGSVGPGYTPGQVGIPMNPGGAGPSGDFGQGGLNLPSTEQDLIERLRNMGLGYDQQPGAGGAGTGQGGLNLPNIAGLDKIFPGGLGSFNLADPSASVQAALAQLGLGGGGGGRGGGGGGGGRGGNLFSPEQIQALLNASTASGVPGASANFLQGAFANPSSMQVGLDPSILALIQGEQGTQSALLERFLAMFQDQNNPFLQALTGAGGGGYGGMMGGGGDLSAPDIQLRRLDPATLRNLETLRGSELGSFRMASADRQDALRASLFGRGVNRSTVALDEGGRLSYGEDQLLRQIFSDHAQRVTSLEESDAQRRAALAQSQLAANASIRSANASAGASLGAARMNALSNAFSSQLGALGRLFADQTGFNTAALSGYQDIGQTGISSNAGILQQLLSTAGQQTVAREGNTSNLLQQLISSDAQRRAAQIAASASRYNAGLDFALGSGNLANTTNRNLIDIIMGLGGLANQRYGLDLNAQQQAFDQEGPSTLDRLGSLLPIFLQAAQTFGWFGAGKTRATGQ